MRITFGDATEEPGTAIHRAFFIEDPGHPAFQAGLGTPIIINIQGRLQDRSEICIGRPGS